LKNSNSAGDYLVNHDDQPSLSQLKQRTLRQFRQNFLMQALKYVRYCYRTCHAASQGNLKFSSFRSSFSVFGLFSRFWGVPQLLVWLNCVCPRPHSVEKD